MGSAERGGKSAVFLCRPDRTTMPRSQRGGYGMAKSSNAAKPLSSICLNRLWLAVLKRPSRCGRGRKAEDGSDPPQNRGVMRSLTDGICGMPLCGTPWGRSRPHLSLREGLEKPPFPSRFIVSDRSSPSRVRFAASRPGRLRADPKDALLTRGKGGIGPWGARTGCQGDGSRTRGVTNPKWLLLGLATWYGVRAGLVPRRARASRGRCPSVARGCSPQRGGS